MGSSTGFRCVTVAILGTGKVQTAFLGGSVHTDSRCCSRPTHLRENPTRGPTRGEMASWAVGRGPWDGLALCIRLQGSISAMGKENINIMLLTVSGNEVSAGSNRAHRDARLEAALLSSLAVKTQTPTRDQHWTSRDTMWPPASPAPWQDDNGSEMQDHGVCPRPSTR